jgi:hypothetical protein
MSQPDESFGAKLSQQAYYEKKIPWRRIADKTGMKKALGFLLVSALLAPALGT